MTVKEAHDIMRQLRELEFPFALRSSTRLTTLKLSDVEKCAVGVFYRSMGQAMEIPFHLLPSNKAGYTDGIHFAQELCDFAAEYEKTAVKPTKSTLFISRRLMSLETANYPSALKPVVERIIAIRLQEHNRLSMGYHPAGIVLSSLVASLVAMRKFVLRYLSLPRPDFMTIKVLDAAPDASTERYTFNEWLDNPWYVKPTLLNRWGPKAWSVRLFGTGNVPTSNGPFRGEGYDMKSIGPPNMENKGQAEVEAIFEGFKGKSTPAGCPFHA
ncbi:hypothetical protein BDV26DRAFT_298391 [Aspergillus bertholletiae]|uniref:Uncharacterized protein n=1 Tax=Aspergillus bertholletiae TaxID=1226010 RepID=A0A5N7APV2_9EURO|nr:hypothetical protein BDV26DRAFT_298391 [Aspergillus bertholletiae]